MKNRKTIIVGFILVACMIMGVGYAALSTTLRIDGQASVSAEAIEFTENVIFTAAKTDAPTFGTAAVNDGNQSATFTVTGMTRKDDAVHFTYTITNKSDHDVNLAVTIAPTTTALDSKFTVTQSLAAGNHLVASEASIDVVVTVKLNEDVNAAVDPVNYVIEYTATSVEP